MAGHKLGKVLYHFLKQLRLVVQHGNIHTCCNTDLVHNDDGKFVRILITWSPGFIN